MKEKHWTLIRNKELIINEWDDESLESWILKFKIIRMENKKFLFLETDDKESGLLIKFDLEKI